MLKRNLVRTSFFSHGFLLLVPGVAAFKTVDTTPLKEERTKLISREWKQADTLIVQKIMDTASYAAKAESVMAPQIQLNKHAAKFVKSFLKREEEALLKTKNRSLAYFSIIDTIFTKYGLPLELRYLAVIESDLKTTAMSRVGARGMWQLMPVTAKELGLKITKKYDERTNAYRSTVAAAKYLKSLYAEFGDWLLVIAAYNSGPGTVLKAIKKTGTRNFWALQNSLPAESRAHVKRYIGAHYYFEGKGSLTTLTRTESIAYVKALSAFNASTDEASDTAEVSTAAILQ